MFEEINRGDAAVTDVPVSEVASDAPVADATGPVDASAAESGTTGTGVGAGGCIPIYSSMRMCTDPARSYAYVCMNGPNPPPEMGCMTGVGAIGNIVCCARPFCIRDMLSDYQCTPTNPSRPPNAYLCYNDAPFPAGCVTTTGMTPSGPGSTRICCP